MKLKSEKFISLSNVYKLFSEYKNNIFLLVHINNTNTVERDFINIYCKKHNIKSIKVKSNVIKKVVNNNLFLNLFAGPTNIYIFSDFINYLNFFSMPSVKKKLNPLTVYWDNSFFSYTFFNTFLLFEIYKNKNKLLAIVQEQQKVLFNLSNYLKILLINIRFLNLFPTINYYKNNKIKSQNVNIKSIN